VKVFTERIIEHPVIGTLVWTGTSAGLLRTHED